MRRCGAACMWSIALASLVANREEYAKQRANFSTDWNAKRIVDTLERINPKFYPATAIRRFPYTPGNANFYSWKPRRAEGYGRADDHHRHATAP